MSQGAPAKPIKTQALRFALLSGLSFLVNLSMTALLHEWAGLSGLVAVPIAMACVTVMNFAALRWFVFGHDGRGVGHQFAGFVASIAGFRLAEYAAFALLHGVFGSPYLITYATILVASLIGKFTLLRGTVFRTYKPPTRPNPA
ncbi:MAG: GtrA family protein [Phycisphaeraceae bacterium]